MFDSPFALEIGYLIGTILFIIGLRQLSHPDTARKGNMLAGVGMIIAIIVTLLFYDYDPGAEFVGVKNMGWILAAIAVASVIGWMVSVKIKMTAMPELVSLFNGLGGAAAATIAMVEYTSKSSFDTGTLAVLFLSLVIGGMSFTGSMIAYGKLAGKVGDIFSPIMTWVNLLFLIGSVGIIGYGLASPDAMDGNIAWILLGISLAYGIFFVMPIGGADMPVVISLLNSFTGVAAAFAGFLYGNQVMITGGILVGSAGTILTVLMCEAMNRSLLNVIIGDFGGEGGGGKGQAGEQVAKEITLTDAAILCAYAQRVCIVPGYGLAVAQAQHACHEFEKLLEAKGVDVYYAIHPVAGRMPGHMNVLLAEADVPYPKLYEMDDANPVMDTTDVVIVVGANDVVNPGAEDDPGSPIYGMPIIQVHNAKNCIIMKRSMNPGYAGIQNPLFFRDKSRMLFGDAKDSLTKLSSEVKSL
ncbi:MAG: NAD(P)(+) transhydrogenase (Re/Si-specific) subunit beta [Bacteroidota bacterium]